MTFLDVKKNLFLIIKLRNGIPIDRWYEVFGDSRFFEADSTKVIWRDCMVGAIQVYFEARELAKEHFEGDELDTLLTSLNQRTKSRIAMNASLAAGSLVICMMFVAGRREVPDFKICYDATVLSLAHKGMATLSFFEKNPELLGNARSSMTIQASLKSYILESERSLLKNTSIYTLEDIQMFRDLAELNFRQWEKDVDKLFTEDEIRMMYGGGDRTVFHFQDTFSFNIWREPQEDLLTMLLRVQERWVRDNQRAEEFSRH